MKLWILEAKDKELPDNDNPWKPWYDKMFGIVVAANTEEEARKIANEGGCDEVRSRVTKPPWMEEKYSTCEVLKADKAGMVIADTWAA